LDGGVGVGDDAGVGAEVVEAAGDGGGGDVAETGDGGGDLGGGAIGVEGAVDEEVVGQLLAPGF
jgi:hypothetical protein